jgi:hemerythrin
LVSWRRITKGFSIEDKYLRDSNFDLLPKHMQFHEITFIDERGRGSTHLEHVDLNLYFLLFY